MAYRTREDPAYIRHAELTWASTSTLTIGKAATRSCMRDSTDAVDIEFDGTLTANIANSGANGRDAGAEAANTWYAVHVIFGSSGVACLLSVSATAPTMPSGYTFFRRVGWVRNNGSSNFVSFFQSGLGQEREYLIDETRTNVTALSAGTATAFTAVPLASYVPPTCFDVILTASFDSATPNDVAEFRKTGSSISAPATFFRVGIAAPTGVTGQFKLMTNASQQIDYRVSNGDVDIFVVGYEDKL